jgi:hypothetical protein
VPPRTTFYEAYPLKDLRPADYNPRRLSEDVFERLKESIGRHGMVKPVILIGESDSRCLRFIPASNRESGYREQAVDLAARPHDAGSSPRARGAEAVGTATRDHHGTIPAGAGSSRPAPRSALDAHLGDRT